jgi:hypothetical protein
MDLGHGFKIALAEVCLRSMGAAAVNQRPFVGSSLQRRSLRSRVLLLPTLVTRSWAAKPNGLLEANGALAHPRGSGILPKSCVDENPLDSGDLRIGVAWRDDHLEDAPIA